MSEKKAADRRVLSDPRRAMSMLEPPTGSPLLHPSVFATQSLATFDTDAPKGIVVVIHGLPEYGRNFSALSSAANFVTRFIQLFAVLGLVLFTVISPCLHEAESKRRRVKWGPVHVASLVR